MASIKCRHYIKICKTTCGMTKHLLMYKMQQGIARRTVSHNTLYKTNGFLMAEAEAILPLVELISKKESPYADAFDKRDPTFDRKDLANIDKAVKMLGRSEDKKMLDIRHIPPKNKHITFS